jgi:hypothetical protein
MPPDEITLIAKARSLGCQINLVGLATVEQRKDIVRAAIDPVLDVTFSLRNGKRITMAMQYAQAYGEVP